VLDAFGQSHPTSFSQWMLGESWPIYVLYMVTISGLLAASLIDAELFIIPTPIPYVIAVLAFVLHTIADRPWVPGSLNLVGDFGPSAAALAAGAATGLAISIALWWTGVMPTSFPDGEPLLDVDRAAIEEEIKQAKQRGEPVDDEPLPPPYTPQQVRAEIRKEILFLLPPLALGGAWLACTMFVSNIGTFWTSLLHYDWFTGLLGSLLGAMVGGFVVWLTRILGTFAFRRVAMGLGDVHLMFGVGAVIGAGGATIAFFLAPFFGILIAIYMMITRKGREMPLGPYLSLATAFVMLSYCPIAAYLTPGLQGLVLFLGGLFGHG
jgi:leader peptidase (prepilin peptidase)/N-methyltransferase